MRLFNASSIIILRRTITKCGEYLKAIASVEAVHYTPVTAGSIEVRLDNTAVPTSKESYNHASQDEMVPTVSGSPQHLLA